MTPRQRREPLKREPSLISIALAQPMTGRGFAASRGVRLPKAMETGRSTSKPVHGRPDASQTCTADPWCDENRRPGFLWCDRHCQRAEQLNAVVPSELADL